jgi:sulfopyruvate decarboxylase alpha subunit
MQRYDYLKAIAGNVDGALVVVAHAAREWNAVRPGDGNLRIRTLGMTSSTALGVALGLPHRKVIAIDGDGGFLMNLCGLPTIAQQNPGNLIHLLFDNGRYETAGGARTATATVVDAVAVAKGAGYRNACWVERPEQFRDEFQNAWNSNQLSLIAAKVDPGSPQPFSFPIDEIENKYHFIRNIEAVEKKRVLPIADHGAAGSDYAPHDLTAEVTDDEQHAMILVGGLKSAGINFVASLPDRKYAKLVDLLAGDRSIHHVPLCREEEGVGICTGAYVTGKKTAIVMQNAGFLNSCNALTTLAIQHEIPLLLLIYYAGDMGDRGFASLGAVTEPVLAGLGIRTSVLRKIERAEETLVDAQILAEDSKRPVAVLLTKEVLGVKHAQARTVIADTRERRKG